MPTGPHLGGLHRYQRRFGGSGTIVSLADRRAVTAAHCLAAVDGGRGVIIGNDTCQWRVLERWLPECVDLALLRTVGGAGSGAGSPVPGYPPSHAVRLATRVLVRRGTRVAFVAHTGWRFERRAASVIALTSSSATAVIAHPAGVCAGDSGGPVFVDGLLVGIVTHRTGPSVSVRASSQLVFTRLDSPVMRRQLRSVRA